MSGVAGLVTTTVTAPVDMVKTNMFVNSSLYSGPWDCIAQIYRAQGVRGLFKGCAPCCAVHGRCVRRNRSSGVSAVAGGDRKLTLRAAPPGRRWGANWARQGPMTTVIFVVSEELRHRMGLEAM